MKNLPNILTFSRIILSAVMLFLSPVTLPFMIAYIISGLSDIADGTIARCFSLCTKLGEKLDSAADIVFVAVCLIKLLPIVKLPIYTVIWIFAIAVTKAVGMIIQKNKNTHTIPNKITGFLLFILPMTLSFIAVKCSAPFLCAVATVAVLDDFSLFKRKKQMTEQYKFRKAEITEKEKIAVLYESVKYTEFCTWDEYYPFPDKIAQEIENGLLYVLAAGDQIVAAVSVVGENELDELEYFQSKTDSAEIARVAVAPEYQGRGISHILVENIENVLRENGKMAVHLLVAIKNIPAYKSYLRLGYKIMGREFMYGNDYYAAEKLL